MNCLRYLTDGNFAHNFVVLSLVGKMHKKEKKNGTSNSFDNSIVNARLRMKRETRKKDYFDVAFSMLQ